MKLIQDYTKQQLIEKAVKSKHKFRSKEVTPTIITCPNHVRQKTYLLYDNDDFLVGIGCRKCFDSLKVTKNKEVTNFRKLLDELVEILNRKDVYEEQIMSEVHDWLKKNNLKSWHDRK